MEKDEEFFHTFFSLSSQLCFDKAKEHIDKERESNRTFLTQSFAWSGLLAQLVQLTLAEKSYMEIGFLQNKNKGFLRKDNSLKLVYETIRMDLRRIEDLCKQPNDGKIINYCQNTIQFISARINMIDVYEKIYLNGINKTLKYNELLQIIEAVIQRNILSFTDLTLTPIKAVFSLECSILEQLFKALLELQRLQFLSSLSLIHGAHTRLSAWENKIQNKEIWKLGFLKTNQVPALLQWHMKFKGAVLSKFSLFFHDTLASQTTPNEMRQLCSKLQFDFYFRMVNFQKKYDASSVLFISNSQVSCDTTDYDMFPVIVSCPPRPPPQLDLILRMLSDSSIELQTLDKYIYKYSTQDKMMFILTLVEPNIYMVLVFESKKTEKDTYITNFISEVCLNIRCTKIFASLKNQSK